MKFLNKNNCEIKKQRGFTLIELLVVIAIIGILSSVVLASLNSARSKARDAQRIAGVKEIQKALELYYSDKGYYPGNSGTEYYYSYTWSPSDGCGWLREGYLIGTWCLLETVLKPYIPKLPRDPLGNQETYYYKYKYIYTQGPNRGPDMYGLSVKLENSNSIAKNDGGAHIDSFEVGGLPSYCSNKYTGKDWDIWNGASACGNNGDN